jgi:hypothetical protein
VGHFSSKFMPADARALAADLLAAADDWEATTG